MLILLLLLLRVVDITIAGDSRIEGIDLEMTTRYKDLQIGLEQLWQKKTAMIPVVIGAWGAIPKHLEKHLSNI